MSFFKNLFASDNTRALNRINKIIEKITALDEEFSKKTDAELQAMTPYLKGKLANGATLDDILPEAFATVREASARVLKMKHYVSQLIGGIVLHQGRIAEMKTGEGKTLVSTLPAYLNALSGKGVHVVTVNEYLAKRDAEWMGKLHRFLGLTVGVSIREQSDADKKQAYACDITYSTNSELGFDYLRDNMKADLASKVQRGHNFVVIDEVDSILIDEARTPLIISGRGFKPSENYVQANKFAMTLKDEDVEIDEERNQVRLTDSGIEKAEKFYKVENLYDIDNVELNQYIKNAITAVRIKQIDRHYIVKDGEVVLVDESTGRIMPGRRLSEGLHQAIEAKEGVEIKDESVTLATITYQNYFRLYDKMSGMTGTAKTEETEFRKIYGLDVVTIPTNRPVQRIDHPDIVYTSIAGKLRAVIKTIKEAHEKGQPILVGTSSVVKSEELSKMLHNEKIPHTVLNAKNPEQESLIVAQAGKKGMVTIATNMAGRGTDILLGGNPEFIAKQALRDAGYNDAQIELATGYNIGDNPDILKAKELYDKKYAEAKVETDKQKQEVIDCGGLFIIGTERHESRRVDNQLRGRAGRQGDVGESVFFISLEDDLARIFGGDKLKSIANFFKMQEDEPIALKILSKQIEQAQKRIEGNHYANRRYVLEYDDVLNQQRKLIYAERNKVLEGVNMHDEITDMILEQVAIALNEVVDPNKVWSEWDIEEINNKLEEMLFEKGTNFVTEDNSEGMELQELIEFVQAEMLKKFEEKKADFDALELPAGTPIQGSNIFEIFERAVMLRSVDHFWMEHIDTMETLKREISTQSYGNQDPIISYKREARRLFEIMIGKIRRNIALSIIKMQKPVLQVRSNNPVAMNSEREKQNLSTNDSNKPIQAKSDKLTNRNSPCPCGSGKKYKNCCGR